MRYEYKRSLEKTLSFLEGLLGSSNLEKRKREIVLNSLNYIKQNILTNHTNYEVVIIQRTVLSNFKKPDYTILDFNGKSFNFYLTPSSELEKIVITESSSVEKPIIDEFERRCSCRGYEILVIERTTYRNTTTEYYYFIIQRDTGKIGQIYPSQEFIKVKMHI